MNLRKLSPLVVVFALLVTIAVFQKRRPNRAKLVDEAGLIALPTASIEADEIRGIDLYYGAIREGAIKLRRLEMGWVAIDYFHAPIQQAKIDALLQALVHLQGDFRSDQAELLTDFALETGQAYHLLIFTRSFDQSAVHLLIGKRKSKVGFIRLQDDPRVYSVSLELFNVLGVRPDQTGQPPETKSWLDLQVQNIAGHAIESFALQTPQRTWEFKRVLPSATKTDVALKSDHEPRWVLVNPGIELTLIQNRVEDVIAILRKLRAEDIAAADADRLAGYGLLIPDYAATVTWRSKDDRIHSNTISIGREHPQQKGRHYIRRGQSGPVYILPDGTFKRLFPNPKQFLALPALDIQPDALHHIALTSSTRSIQFERSDATLHREERATTKDRWRLSYPPVDFELLQDSFEKWIQRIITFSPDALAPESFKPDAAEMVRVGSIELVLNNKTRNSIRFGDQIKGYPQHYALFFNTFSTPFAITQTTRQLLLPRLNDLVIMRPLKADPENIKQLSWNIGNGMWRIARYYITSHTENGDKVSVWRFLHPEAGDVDRQRLKTILQIITNSKADDWYESLKRNGDEAERQRTLSLEFQDHRIVKMIMIDRENSSEIRYSHLPGVFFFSKAHTATLLESLKALESNRIQPLPALPD